MEDSEEGTDGAEGDGEELEVPEDDAKPDDSRGRVRSESGSDSGDSEDSTHCVDGGPKSAKN
jgi:hypothetical protein